MNQGCNSVVVSRQSQAHREWDGLVWLTYTSNKFHGGAALWFSFCNSLAIRVFVSSDGNSVLSHLPFQMVKLLIGSLVYLTLLVPGTKMAIKSGEERNIHFQARGAVMGLNTHFIYKGTNQICYLIKNSKT